MFFIIKNKLRNKIEAIFNRNKFPIFPKSIIIRITNKCNLDCAMCGNSKDRMNHSKDRDFTLEDIKVILPDIVRYRPTIVLSGGEPLLIKDIFEIINILTRNKIRVIFLSNGVLVANFIKEIVNSDMSAISLPLDHYIGKVHDKIRGVKGSFDLTIKGIRELGKARQKNSMKMGINITTVITKDNYSELVKIYDFIEKLGYIDLWDIRHLSFVSKDIYQKQLAQKKGKYPIDCINGMVMEDSDYFSEKEIEMIKNQLLLIDERSKSYKTNILVEKSIFKYLKSYYLGEDLSNISSCNGKEGLWIRGDKLMNFCGYEIGDIKKDSIHKVWNSPKNINFQNYISNNKLPHCYRCSRLLLK